MNSVLSPEKIDANWKKHLNIVQHFVEDPRKQQIFDMFQELEDKMILAPASSRSWYHNAFPGGYVDHVNRVVECSIKLTEMWGNLGALIDYSYEEIIVAAIVHDLGKIGDGDQENYLIQTDNWRRDKLREMYSKNKDLQFMLIQDRSLYLLQKYGIKLNWKEYLGIRTHDGIFDDANKPYFISSSPDSRFKTNLPYVLHQADFMASKIEFDLYSRSS